MNKNLLAKTMSGIGGAVVGGAAGLAAGTAHAPVVTKLAMTAPVSYPLAGLAQSIIIYNSDEDDKALKMAIGMVTSVCLIPLAPLTLFFAPFIPVTYGVLGAIGGGALGVLVAEEQLSQQ